MGMKRLFYSFAILCMLINFDGGAVPAGLTNIEATFQLEPFQVGLLGSLVYIGQAIGSLVAGPVLLKCSPIKVVRTCLLCNTVATAMFGLAPSTGTLLCFRFLIGFLQAPVAVYFPVWVDEFAPASSRTLWLAVIQAGGPLGIMVGYVLAGLLTSSADGCSGGSGWRVPFLVQSAGRCN